MAEPTPAAPDAPAAAENLGSAIRAAREAHGLSLRELARRLEVSPSFVSQMERGKANPSVGTLYALVSELGMSLNELLGGPAGPVQLLSPASWPRIDQPVVRAGDRGRVQMSGVVWARLTADDPTVHPDPPS